LLKQVRVIAGFKIPTCPASKTTHQGDMMTNKQFSHFNKVE